MFQDPGYWSPLPCVVGCSPYGTCSFNHNCALIISQKTKRWHITRYYDHAELLSDKSWHKVKFSQFCMKKTRAEFVLMIIFYPSSPKEVMFVKTATSDLVLSGVLCRWLWKQPHPKVRIAELIIVQSEIVWLRICRLCCFKVKIQLNCKHFSTVWTTTCLCLGCVLYFRNVKCCYRSGLARSRIMFYWKIDDLFRNLHLIRQQ